MKRIWFFLAALMVLSGCMFTMTETAQAAGLDCSGEIGLFSISRESMLSSCGDTADLSLLGDDEIYSFVLHLSYNGSKDMTVKNMYARVDGGDKWGWASFTLHPGDAYAFHIYSHNMQTCMTAGTHKVTWYINDKAVLTKSFTLTAPTDWYSRFPMPSASQIKAANESATVRSPYLYGWQKIDQNFRYTEYSADFKADYVPKATYCALANLEMDLSALKKQYKSVRAEYNGVTLYAGFQRRWNEYITIMSGWDIYCTDKNGTVHTLRPRQLYPEKIYIGDGTFSGEGAGTQILVPYDWEAGHWYRMLLQCGTSEGGTTTVEQWVCDLETGAWTLMCRFDTLIPNSCFIGPNAFFLENFDTDYAGEIRTMEVCNIRVRDAKTGKWKSVKSASLGSNGGLPNYNGSYNYGADSDCFWMITSGAGGDWYGTSKVPKKNKQYSVKNGEASSPY